MFNRLKIKLTITQLVSSSFFLGYNKKIRNPKSNFFILGESAGDDIFNIQLSLTLIKKKIFLFTSFFKSNCRVWVINNGFDLLHKLEIFKNLSVNKFAPSVNFLTNKFIAGSFTNYKSIRSFEWSHFPHAVFFPNIFNNYYIINECARIGVPSFGILDNCDSPFNLFFPVAGNSKSLKPLVLMYFLIIRSYYYAKIYKCSSFIFSIFDRIFKKLVVLKKKFRRIPYHFKKYRAALSLKNLTWRRIFLTQYGLRRSFIKPIINKKILGQDYLSYYNYDLFLIRLLAGML